MSGGQELGSLIKRSFSLAGHRTSVALESEFWEVLARTAETRGQTLSAMVAEVDAAREPRRSLASALRVAALLAETR
jgi:predicted DNA-binding ribbon-helix-helix protein